MYAYSITLELPWDFFPHHTPYGGGVGAIGLEPTGMAYTAGAHRVRCVCLPHRRAPSSTTKLPCEFPQADGKYAVTAVGWHHALRADGWVRENWAMNRLVAMVLHYAIVIALVLHLVSCIFLGESRMPETLH